MEREQEQRRTAVVQTLTGIVSTLQEDQRSLRQQVAVMEGRGEPLPPIAAGPPPASPAAATAPSVTLAPASPPAVPDLLFPHPLAASFPAAESEPPPAAAQSSKLDTSREKSPPPMPGALEEQGPIAGEVRTRLVNHLRSHAGRGIVIQAAAHSPQSAKVATALQSVFRDAGWSVGRIEMITRDLPTDTLTLSTGSYPPSKAFVAAYGGLARAGFLVTSDLAPNQAKHGVALSVGPMR